MAEVTLPRALSNVDPALRQAWHPVARSGEVAGAPHRSVLLGEPWVLVRLEGELRAFRDRCPHRRAPLSLGTADGTTLACGYHGWRFGADGACTAIPALGEGTPLPPRARLEPAWGVLERQGVIFLAPEAPLAPLGEVPEAADPAFLAGELPVVVARASAGLLADNFLDLAHFPFVHAATFGAEEPVVPPLEVRRDGLSFTAVSEHTFANREDPGVTAGLRPLLQRRRVTYRVTAPFHLVLRLDFLDAGGSNVIGFFLQPEAVDRCRIYCTLWRDDLAGDPARMAEAVAFEEAVLAEDLAVQEAYDERELPLGLTSEVHTRADRSTIELRRLLAALVGVAGTVDGTGAPGAASGGAATSLASAAAGRLELAP